VYEKDGHKIQTNEGPTACRLFVVRGKCYEPMKRRSSDGLRQGWCIELDPDLKFRRPTSRPSLRACVVTLTGVGDHNIRLVRSSTTFNERNEPVISQVAQISFLSFAKGSS